jgi:hypothetical protein
VNFADEVYLSYLAVFLTRCKLLRYGPDGFTSLRKEVVLLIFMELKNPSLPVGFEPVKLGSSGKHDNYCTA